MTKPLAVSIGDPSGIGPDIILSAWLHRKSHNLPSFFIAGDPAMIERRSKLLGLDLTIAVINPEDAAKCDDDTLSVLALSNHQEGKAGKPSAADAAGTIEAIERCVDLVLEGTAAAIVTCPINKKALYDTGFMHPGHTEFLAELAVKKTGIETQPVMMLAGPDLKVIPVTIHIPLSKVPEQLTTELIVETGIIVANELGSRFGISHPRLAISGLNPHAGESGALGDEDDTIIQPAVAQLIEAGIDASGPLPADTMFHPAARAQYDAALCMYHDQALIPAKTLAFDDSVNVTLGLPFVRTSPDHGTAFDIAGSGKANPASFVAALKMAAAMTGSQA